MPKLEIFVPWNAPAKVDAIIDRLRAAGLAGSYERTSAAQGDRITFEGDNPATVAGQLGLLASGLTIRTVGD